MVRWWFAARWRHRKRSNRPISCSITRWGLPYYQLQAVNKTMRPSLPVSAAYSAGDGTGTNKTYTAFQIIWRFVEGQGQKRILFLADRNILVDQTKTNDFQPFGTAMTKITRGAPSILPTKSTSLSIRR